MCSDSIDLCNNVIEREIVVDLGWISFNTLQCLLLKWHAYMWRTFRTIVVIIAVYINIILVAGQFVMEMFRSLVCFVCKNEL